MNRMRKRIAVTMGDPTGVGPEIIVKALSSGAVDSLCDTLVIGRPNVLRRAAERSRLHVNILETAAVDEWVAGIATHHSYDQQPRTIACLTTGSSDADDAIEPKIDARGGQAAYDCLIRATQLTLSGKFDAIVTAPLHKVALHAAGHDWPGHTELLAELCGVAEHAMMLYLPPGRPRHGGPAGFGVVHVTLHMAMREIFQHLTIEAIDEKIRLANNVFERIRASMGIHGAPAIATAALNPHAGEGGRFGDEEVRIIEPAVRLARSRGIDVVGPLPVDTLMPAAVEGKYDAVVAMYHDQGHIALKLLDMFDAVNVTLGLPIIRTSVAHGTAHDIAWSDRAEASGMIQAILTAARLAN
jgi:4-hydroxythreonine-4-phosphate dehydrogenase